MFTVDGKVRIRERTLLKGLPQERDLAFADMYGYWLVLGLNTDEIYPVSDCQYTSCNGDPSIRRHSGIWGAADEAVLNTVRKKIKIKIKSPPFKKKRDEVIF